MNLVRRRERTQRPGPNTGHSCCCIMYVAPPSRRCRCVRVSNGMCCVSRFIPDRHSTCTRDVCNEAWPHNPNSHHHAYHPSLTCSCTVDIFKMHKLYLHQA